LEEIRCDLCGAEHPQPFLDLQDRYTGGKFQLARCTQCGLIYLPTRPGEDELEQYYPEDYEAYYLLDQQSSAQTWHLKRALSLQLKMVESVHPARGKLLDIGSATGNFLHVAREAGWQVLGLEPVEKAAQLARQNYQLEVISGTITQLDLPPASFDVISMWDVLEHLPSPKQALHKSWELLKPGGFLVFSIPNLDSFDRYLFGNYWIGWDVPRHFNLFSRSTLKQLLGEIGFEIITSRCILGGKGTFLLSLDMLIDQKKLSPGIRKIYPLLSALLWPYRQISYLLERGPIITYVVKKSKTA
jgi:2-polyprenyl-3-methyl-5-hydroxy-6-metoxy-1,4-benzoquinol methylase